MFRDAKQGFSLIQTLIGLGITSISLLALTQVAATTSRFEMSARFQAGFIEQMVINNVLFKQLNVCQFNIPSKLVGSGGAGPHDFSAVSPNNAVEIEADPFELPGPRNFPMDQNIVVQAQSLRVIENLGANIFLAEIKLKTTKRKKGGFNPDGILYMSSKIFIRTTGPANNSTIAGCSSGGLEAQKFKSTYDFNWTNGPGKIHDDNAYYHTPTMPATAFSNITLDDPIAPLNIVQPGHVEMNFYGNINWDENLCVNSPGGTPPAAAFLFLSYQPTISYSVDGGSTWTDYNKIGITVYHWGADFRLEKKIPVVNGNTVQIQLKIRFMTKPGMTPSCVTVYRMGGAVELTMEP